MHDTRTISTIISVDDEGQPDVIRYANWAFQHVDASQRAMKEVGIALAKFAAIVEAPENNIQLKLQPGEMLLVNNNQVLHGRLPFDPTTGERHFQQVYMEIDDIEARHRCL